MIGLISSVPEEGKLVRRRITEKTLSASTSPHLPVVSGNIYGKEVAYVISGMGKTNAAHAATILIERFAPDLVILFGVGGAYPSTGLNVGDIAIAEKEIYGDDGVLLHDGFHGTELIGIPLLKRGRKKYFNEFELDGELVEKASRFLAHRPSPIACRLRSGAFVTVSTCTGTRKRAFELRKKFDGLCENMEGAAVAHVCAIYGFPLIEIRGISNIVEDRDRGKWNIKLAAENCQKAVTELVKVL